MGALAAQAIPRLAVAATATPDWFKFDPRLGESWEFRMDGADAHVVVANPAGFSVRPAMSVLVVYSKSSSAYDIAISRVLEVIDDKRMRVGFRVVNYGGDLERLRSHLDAAERDGLSAVLAMGSDPVSDLLDVYRGGRLPVVTICAKDPVVLGQMKNYDEGSGFNFAFTSLNMPVDVQMGYLLEVRPQLKNLAILVDAGNVSAMETQCKPVAEFLNRREIRALQLVVRDSRAVRDELPPLLTHAISVMQRNDPALKDSAFWITGSTSIFQEISLINSYSGVVPVLSVVPEVVAVGDDSAALSIGVSFQSNAHLAAIYLSDILRQADVAANMKVGVVSPPDIAINFRRARAVGLRIPFDIFERATTIYDYDGKLARSNGVMVAGK